MSGRILVADSDGMYLMKFVGDVRVNLCAAVDDFLADMYRDKDFKSVVVDLSRTDGIDSTSLGVLAKLSIAAREQFGFKPTLVSTSYDITRILRTMGFDDIFHIVEQPLREEGAVGRTAAGRVDAGGPAPARPRGAPRAHGHERVERRDLPRPRRYARGGAARRELTRRVAARRKSPAVADSGRFGAAGSPRLPAPRRRRRAGGFPRTDAGATPGRPACR